MEQYCMYLRKSRADLEAELRGEGETLARHKRHLLALAKSMKINITKIYQEIVSGERIIDRPKVLKLLQDVEDRQWSGVLVMEVERLARGDTIDQGIVAQAFKTSSTRIITPVKTYDPNNEFDEEYFEFGLFMARREYKTITRRLQRGRVASVKEGNYLGNRPPYGYVRVRNDTNDGYTLTPHPDQGPIIRLIFEMYVYQGVGTGTIARKLNDMKVPTAKNSLWGTATINGIIRNPVYMGHVRWNSRPEARTKTAKSRPRLPRKDWIEVVGKHPPLIDKDLFDQAQEILEANSHPPAPKGKISNPLAGLVRCGICDRAMVLRPYSRQPAHLICSNPMCFNKSSLFTYVEEKLIQALRMWMERYKAEYEFRKHPYRDSPVNVASLKEALIQNLEKERQQLVSQKEKLFDLLERGVYSEDMFLERSKNLSGRITELEQAISTATLELSQEEQRTKTQLDIIPQVEHVLELYSRTSNAAKKNDLLKTVITHAAYKKEKHQRLNDFTLTLYPKLPKSW